MAAETTAALNAAACHFCRDSPTSPMHLNFTEYQTTQLGAASIADYLRMTGVLAMPLEFAPGASYHYSNPGYSIVGHIIEKVICYASKLVQHCLRVRSYALNLALCSLGPA